MNSEQIIQQLAESAAMRKAAKWTAYLFFRGKAIGEEKMEQLRESEMSNRSKSFARTFTKELSDALQNIRKESKK